MTDQEKLERSLKIIKGCVLMEQIETAKIYLKSLWGNSWDAASGTYMLATDPRPVCKARRALDKRIDTIDAEVSGVYESSRGQRAYARQTQESN